jgi:hypothetical protein
MAGTVEDRSSYVRVHKIGAATAPGGRRTEAMPPPCFEDAFFFSCQGTDLQRMMFTFSEASNFLICHLSEPRALPQHTECLQTANDPFTKQLGVSRESC